MNKYIGATWMGYFISPVDCVHFPLRDILWEEHELLTGTVFVLFTCVNVGLSTSGGRKWIFILSLMKLVRFTNRTLIYSHLLQ